MKTLNAAGVIAAGGLAASASAGILTQTGFEATGVPAYAVGNLIGQNGWVEFANVPGTAAATKFAVVNNAGNAFVGSQFVEANTVNWGADSTLTGGIRYRFAWIDQTVTAGDLATDPIVHTQWAMRVNTPTGLRENIAAMAHYHGGGTYESLEVQVRTSANQLVIFNDTAGIAFSAASGPGGTWLNQYLLIDTYLDYSTGLFSVVVNGASLDAALDGAAFSRAFDTGQIFSDSDITGYRTSSTGNTGGAVMRFDNLLIELIPAPSSVALLGLGGLMAARRRRA